MTTATEVVLQSGMPVTALRLAPGIFVRRTEGPVGVFVEGVDLADPLTGDQIHSLITIWNNAGVMILRGQDRLTAERQTEVVEWFGRRFSAVSAPTPSTSSRWWEPFPSSSCRTATGAGPAARSSPATRWRPPPRS